MANYVYCTSSCDLEFVDYHIPRNSEGKHTGEPNTIIRKVLIQGKGNICQNVAPKWSKGRQLLTYPAGMTKVSDEDLEFLESNDGFQQMKKDGFIDVRKSAVDLDIAVKSMCSRDKSAPATPSDYQKADPHSPEMWTGKIMLGSVGKVS